MLRLWKDSTVPGKTMPNQTIWEMVGCHVIEREQEMDAKEKEKGTNDDRALGLRMVAWPAPPPGFVVIIETLIGEMTS